MSLALPVPAGHWHKRLDSVDEQWQGRGSSVPLTLDSAGEVRLTLPPTMVVLFVQGQSEGQADTLEAERISLTGL